MPRLIPNLICFFLILNTNGPLICSKNPPGSPPFGPPLEIPLYLSGTYGELRNNHFHAGLDFRTAGVIGQRVNATADGVVSRISVSPSGYGHALYVSHPGGLLTVYGHLNAFREDIARYCREEQYRLKQFAVDLMPDSLQFPVKKGDLIGYSGNTGSSGGPHLHYEIRHRATNSPLNPQRFHNPIRDNIAPVIRNIFIYHFQGGVAKKPEASRQSLIPVKRGNRYELQKVNPIPVSSLAGIGVIVTDASEGSTPRNGPYQLRLLLDQKLLFSQKMDSFPLEKTRMINSLMDFEEENRSGRRINTLWIDPFNRLPVYQSGLGDGLIRLSDTMVHRVRIEVLDFQMNLSVSEFFVKALQDTFPKNPARKWIELAGLHPLNTLGESLDFSFQDSAIHLFIPKGSVYHPLLFHYEALAPDSLYPFTRHVVGNEAYPLHNAFQMRIRARDIPDALTKKVLLARIWPSGVLRPVDGNWDNGWIQATVDAFGTYTPALDTLPPIIGPVSLSVNRGIISTRIRDDFSGIQSYHASIDGEWILSEWDAKTGLLLYRFDKTRLLRTGKRRKWTLEVTDRKGNTSSKSVYFTY